MHRFALFAALMALGVPGVAANASPPVGTSATANVQIGDFFFRPAYTRIEPGDTVTWTMLAGSPHTAASTSGAPVPFNSGELLPGQGYSFTFATAGRYPYLCDLHPFMRGVVQVGPDTVDPVIRRLKANPGARKVRVSFRISEASRVSSKLASTKKPGRVLRRLKPRKFENAGSFLLAIEGFAAGRYRVVVSAKDPEGNVGTARTAFRIPAP